MAERASESSRVQLCGRLSIQLEGVHVESRLRGRQVRMLLAYLVLNRQRPVSREELIEAVWPREPPAAKDAALRTLLSRLRSAVGADVLSGRDQIVLALPEPVWVDLEAAAAELERARRALERGDPRGAWGRAQVPLNIASRGLLAGHQASWLEPARRELEEIRLDALEVIGSAGLRMGSAQVASVERAARSLIEAEPYRESGYVLLMDALALRGNVAEGLRVFEVLRALLRDELGTMPSPESLAAHQRLLRPRGDGGGGAAAFPGPAPAGSGIALPAELRDRAQSPLVGRRQELAGLGRLWETAEQGGGGPEGSVRQIVVLSGDAGIGKTSLAAELARRAHDGGGVVLAGRSQEEGLAPYQPFLEALTHYFAFVPQDGLVPAVREYGPELSRLIPELRRRVPELEAPGRAEPETERYRLFEAVVGLLRAIAEQAPILLVLDDLHWADQPTLLLLRHLARAREPARLLILVAYRRERTDAGVQATLADLRRENLLTWLEVPCLSERETGELVRLRVGRRPSQALVRALYAETEGNPFFVEEIVRSLAGAEVDVATATASELARFRLPASVGEVVGRRLERLGPATVESLRVASVIGREFEAGLLERVVGLDEDEFLAALDESLAAGLLLEAGPAPSPPRYSFAHALIRDSIYQGMSGPRRARLHRRVGEALEATGEAPVRALALHFTRAGEAEHAEKAVGYARAAAAEAVAMLAYDEAAQHYGQALEVLGRLPPNPHARVELLCGLGEALSRAGEGPRGWEAFREAARLARRAGDPAGLARAAIGAARRYVQQPGVVDPELIELLEGALAVTEGEVSLARVRLLAGLSSALSQAGESARMLELSREAERVADQLGQPVARAYASSARRRAQWDAAHLGERLVASTEMLSLARQSGDLELELEAHAWLVVDLLDSGDAEAAGAQIEAFKEGAERLRQPLYLWQASVWDAMLTHLLGSLASAEELAADALAAGGPTESATAHQYFAAALLAIRLEQGRLAELEPTLTGLISASSLRTWPAAHALLLADTGRTGQAGSELERLLGELAADSRPTPDWMLSAAWLSEVCCALQDPSAAAKLHGALLPFAEMNLVAGLGAVCLGPVSRLLGNLAATMGAGSRAAQHLETALEQASRLKSPLWLAHVQLDLAAALEPGLRASRLVEDAEATVERLELPRLAEMASRLRHR